MLRSIVRLYERARKCILDTSSDGGSEKFSWKVFTATQPQILDDIIQMKFEDPLQPEDELRSIFDGVCRRIDECFDGMV